MTNNKGKIKTESSAKKTNPWKGDVLYSPMGQYKYPGEVTRIPGNRITMDMVPYPVLGIGSDGSQKIMMPGGEYHFPGSDYVTEYPYPEMKVGGSPKRGQIYDRLGQRHSISSYVPWAQDGGWQNTYEDSLKLYNIGEKLYNKTNKITGLGPKVKFPKGKTKYSPGEYDTTVNIKGLDHPLFFPNMNLVGSKIDPIYMNKQDESVYYPRFRKPVGTKKPELKKEVPIPEVKSSSIQQIIQKQQIPEEGFYVNKRIPGQAYYKQYKDGRWSDITENTAIGESQRLGQTIQEFNYGGSNTNNMKKLPKMFPQIQSEEQFFSPMYANIPAPYQGGSFKFGGFPTFPTFPTQPTKDQIADYGRPNWPHYFFPDGGSFSGVNMGGTELPMYNYGSDYMNMGGQSCYNCGGAYKKHTGGAAEINQGPEYFTNKQNDFTKWLRDTSMGATVNQMSNMHMMPNGSMMSNDQMKMGGTGYPEMFPYAMPYEYKNGGSKNWIQGAVNPKHKGFCSPMTKKTCTPRRKAFAMTMKKHHGFHKQDGGEQGYNDGANNMDDNQWRDYIFSEEGQQLAQSMGMSAEDFLNTYPSQASMDVQDEAESQGTSEENPDYMNYGGYYQMGGIPVTGAMTRKDTNAVQPGLYLAPGATPDTNFMDPNWNMAMIHQPETMTPAMTPTMNPTAGGYQLFNPKIQQKIAERAGASSWAEYLAGPNVDPATKRKFANYTQPVWTGVGPMTASRKMGGGYLPEAQYGTQWNPRAMGNIDMYSKAFADSKWHNPNLIFPQTTKQATEQAATKTNTEATGTRGQGYGFFPANSNPYIKIKNKNYFNGVPQSNYAPTDFKDMASNAPVGLQTDSGWGNVHQNYGRGFLGLGPNRLRSIDYEFGTGERPSSDYNTQRSIGKNSNRPKSMNIFDRIKDSFRGNSNINLYRQYGGPAYMQDGAQYVDPSLAFNPNDYAGNDPENLPGYTSPGMSESTALAAIGANPADQIDPTNPNFRSKGRIKFGNRMNGEDMANWGITGMRGITGLLNAKDTRKKEKDLQRQFKAENIFATNQNRDRGDYTTNQGYFRPDQQTPVQFPGNPYQSFAKKGGSYNTGDEVDMTDDEIAQFLKNGGQLEFI